MGYYCINYSGDLSNRYGNLVQARYEMKYGIIIGKRNSGNTWIGILDSDVDNVVRCQAEQTLYFEHMARIASRQKFGHQ